jgi:hypothetical protein
MLSDCLAVLEKLCEATLPADYVALLNAYPPHLLSAERAEDGHDSEGTVSEVELLADPMQVVAINQEVRMGTVHDPDGNEFRWPDQLLVIGETGDGDYYCVDCDGEHPGVLQFRHHPVEFEFITDSLQEFVELLLESFAGNPNDQDA